jgi:hypothetical protein
MLQEYPSLECDTFILPDSPSNIWNCNKDTVILPDDPEQPQEILQQCKSEEMSLMQQYRSEPEHASEESRSKEQSVIWDGKHEAIDISSDASTSQSWQPHSEIQLKEEPIQWPCYEFELPISQQLKELDDLSSHLTLCQVQYSTYNPCC